MRGGVPLAAVGLFLAALAVLYEEFSAYGYQEILSDLVSLPVAGVAAALGLTVGGFSVLFLRESVAVRYVGRSVGSGRVALASFLAHAFDQVFGSPLLAGAPVRHRLYASWDLSTDEVGRVVAFETASSWMGLLAVLGGALLVPSTGVATGVPIPGWALEAVGLAGVGIVLGYVAWTLLARAPLHVLSWELPSPSPGLALAQLATGAARWLVAAGVLYVLLPSGHGLPLSRFVGLFALAAALGRISQVPAGIGVFEASLVALLPDPVVDGSLAASLVAYRAVHHLLPSVLAAAGLALHQLGRRRKLVGRTVDTLGRGVSTVVPVILSTLVFVAGAFMLATGALPLPEGRAAWLGRALPLPLVELSHFLGSLVGAGLLILAWGLRQRSDAAYRLTLVLLAVGAVLGLGRGFGWIEAAGLGITLAALLPARGEFFRKASATAALPSARWAVLMGITLAGTVWLGLVVYRRVDLTAELWWEFALRGDAPRFLRATVGVGVLLLGYGMWRLLRPAAPGAEIGVGEEIPPDVDAVVETSSRAHAALVYLGDKRVLLSESRRALVMYATEGRSWIALGDPLGDPQDFDELIWRFRQAAHRHGGWPVFYQARPDSLPLYADVGLGAVKLGEEAYVPLDGFTLEGPGRKGLRRTLRRVEEEGAVFEILPRDEVRRVLPDLRRVSDAWLEEKKAPEKGFSLGFFEEGYLLRTPVAVLRHDDDIVAFANVLAGGTRDELSADLMRYRPGAPASSMEYLFLRLMLWGAAEGYGRFSLGMAPLSGLEAGPLAPLWNRVGSAVFRHGEHFYNFRGLRAYKEKFDPAWEPRYLVTPGGLAFPRILANLATLVGGGVRGILPR